MMTAGWFFLLAGCAAVISSLLDKNSPIVNDVDGNVNDEDRKLLKPTARDRLIYGLVGVASIIYGIYCLKK
jgi:uncharacterized membrane protein HdeD (DUF308 family)